MKYDDAIKLLCLEKNKKYSEQEINSICRKIMLKYHPDKRLSDDPIIVKKEYEEIIEAIETLKNPNNDEPQALEKYGHDEDNVEINIYDFMTSQIPTFFHFYDVKFTSFININTIYNDLNAAYDSAKRAKTQTINFVVPIQTFDLFKGNYTVKKTIDLAIEGKTAEITIQFAPTPYKLYHLYENIGHKNYDECRGDIIATADIVNDKNWNYYPESKKLIVTKNIKISKSKKKFQKNIDSRINETALILPCGSVLSYKLTNKDLLTEHYIGKHPKYKNISIFLTFSCEEICTTGSSR